MSGLLVMLFLSGCGQKEEPAPEPEPTVEEPMEEPAGDSLAEPDSTMMEETEATGAAGH